MKPKKKVKTTVVNLQWKAIGAKSIKAWAGFCNDKLNKTNELHTEEPTYAIYTSRAAAERCYQDVRRVTITLDPKER